MAPRPRRSRSLPREGGPRRRRGPGAAGVTCAVALALGGCFEAGLPQIVAATPPLPPPPAPAALVPGPATAAFVGGSFLLTGRWGSPGSTAACDVCVTTASSCDGFWQPGTWAAGQCSYAGTCSDGAALLLGVRGRDAAGNLSTPLTVARRCDGSGPRVGLLSTTGPAAAYAGPNTQLAAAVADGGGSGVVACQICAAAATAACSWQPGSLADDVCRGAVGPCTDGGPIQLAMQATDAVGNGGAAVPLARTCDALPPQVTGLGVSRNVDNAAVITIAAADAGAGLGDAPFVVYTDAVPLPSATMQAYQPTALTTGLIALPGCGAVYFGLVATDAAGNATSLVPATPAPLPARLGNDGTFAADVGIGGGPMDDVAVGDFDGDGLADVAVASGRRGLVAFYLTGSRANPANPAAAGTRLSLGPVYVASGGVAPTLLQAVDVDVDGKLDLVVADGAAGRVGVLLGPQPTANGGVPLALNGNVTVGGSIAALAVGDVDDDGHANDVLAVGTKLTSLLGGSSPRGLRLGAQQNLVQGGGGQPYPGAAAACADLNGDGLSDALVVQTSPGQAALGFYAGQSAAGGAAKNVAGTFASGPAMTGLAGNGLVGGAAASAAVLRLAPLFGVPGVLDAAVALNLANTIVVLPASKASPGTFGSGSSLTSAGVSGLVVADLNSNGVLDIGAAGNGRFSVYVGGHDGSGRNNGLFGSPSAQATQRALGPLQLADVDGDGLADVVGAVPGGANGADFAALAGQGCTSP